MVNRVLVHSTEQPDSDITAFILSCNRLDILDITMSSFLLTKEYNVKTVIVDDSAEEGVFEQLVSKYGEFSDVICFPKNRSQWWAMDFMVSYCDTQYIFYIEDDWQFLHKGYLAKSKSILEKYRNIGNIDISWRTFENENFDTYDTKLIDEMFFYKKLWRISEQHYHWYGWTGSPNLKRRDDLLLLGRVEKWHNEWNIDRRFLSLGLKSVFLYGQHVCHIGDHCSKMNDRRPTDSTTPEDYYPVELQEDRVWPKLDYYQWEYIKEAAPAIIGDKETVSLVTCLLDLESSSTNQMVAVTPILQSNHPIVIFTEQKYIPQIQEIRNEKPTRIIEITTDKLRNNKYYNDVLRIKSHPRWDEQDYTLKNSQYNNELFLMMSLMKMVLMQEALQYVDETTTMYWIDADIYSTHTIPLALNSYDLTSLSTTKFFITATPHSGGTTIDGYNLSKMPLYKNQVCEPSFFGGNHTNVVAMCNLFKTELEQSLMDGDVGSAAAFFTILQNKYPTLFNVIDTDISDLLATLIQKTD